MPWSDRSRHDVVQLAETTWTTKSVSVIPVAMMWIGSQPRRLAVRSRRSGSARISTAITAMLCAAAIVLGVLLVDGARARQPASVHDAL